MLFDLLLLALVGFLGFTVSMILSGVVRIERGLRQLSEDFRLLTNIYLQKK